jgi:hypothetical protein
MLEAVFRILVSIFLGLPDPHPDPLVGGTDPDLDPDSDPARDPSTIKQN